MALNQRQVDFMLGRLREKVQALSEDIKSKHEITDKTSQFITVYEAGKPTWKFFEHYHDAMYTTLPTKDVVRLYHANRYAVDDILEEIVILDAELREVYKQWRTAVKDEYLYEKKRFKAYQIEIGELQKRKRDAELRIHMGKGAADAEAILEEFE